jgi:chromosome partitioning protein
MKSPGFFNALPGMGKTTLVYHLAWMFAELDKRVLVVDLDPRCSLTTMLVDIYKRSELWNHGHCVMTMRGAVDGYQPHLEHVSSSINLLPGDPLLAGLDAVGPPDLGAVLRQVIHAAADACPADLTIINIGAGLGRLTHSALACSSHIIIPTAGGILSTRSMRVFGPQSRAWGVTPPVGYVLTERGRMEGPIALEYAASVLGEPVAAAHCLAVLTRYRSLMPMALEARKPMFLLKPADGAIGAHVEAVRDCYRDFKALAERILYTVV